MSESKWWPPRPITVIIGLLLLSILATSVVALVMLRDMAERPTFRRTYISVVPKTEFSDAGTLSVSAEFDDFAANTNVRDRINVFIEQSWPTLALQDALRVLYDELSQTAANVNVRYSSAPYESVEFGIIDGVA